MPHFFAFLQVDSVSVSLEAPNLVELALETLSSLPVFDPQELSDSCEIDIFRDKSEIAAYLDAARSLIREAQPQIGEENVHIREYMVHRLRSISMTMGCPRLSFLLEGMTVQKDFSTKSWHQRINDIREEFDQASEAIMTFLTNPEPSPTLNH